ncbi:DUF4132 domain-containing protein [Porticoccus sp. GXU_MW_L64]
MLKTLLGFGGHKDHSSVANCFQLLDGFQKGLAKRIANYVVTGEDVEVLEVLKNLTPDQFYHAGISLGPNYISYHSNRNQKKAELVAKHFKAFGNNKLIADFDVARRLGAVLSFSKRPQSNPVPTKAILPAWLEGLVGSLDNIWSPSYRSVKIPEFIGGQWLIEVAEHNDVSTDVWLRVTLERADSWGSADTLLNQFVKRLDPITLLSRPDVVGALGSLHFSGRVTLAQALNSCNNLDPVLPVVVSLVADKSKQVREKAKLLLAKVSEDKLLAHIKECFGGLSVAQRKELAQWLSVFLEDKAEAFLLRLRDTESSKSVIQAIDDALANKLAAGTESVELKIPGFESLSVDNELPKEWFDLLKKQLANQVQQAYEKLERARKEKEIQGHTRYLQSEYKRLQSISGRSIADALQFLSIGKGQISRDVQNLILQSGLLDKPEFKIGYIVRYIKAQRDHGWSFSHGAFPRWLRSHGNEITDLRQVAELMHQNKMDDKALADWILTTRWESDFRLVETGDITIWPFFAENPQYLDEAFGLVESKSQQYRHYELGYGMLVLRQFPQIPEKYLQLIYQYALSPAKTYGPLARETLTEYGLVEERVIAALASSKQDERIVAANWLGELKSQAAVEPLVKAARKEKRETPKAAMLSALHTLGQCIEEYLSSQVLTDEALAGLKKAMPKGLAWFPFDGIPPLHWNDGSLVDRAVAKWWIVLACKLKQPEGNPLFDLYLAQIKPQDREALGSFILQVFMARDVVNPTDDEATEYARANQQQLFDNWQQWVRYDWGKEYRDKTLEDAYQILFRGRKAEYLGSAISEKGVLALVGYAGAADAVQSIRGYMKDHYTRRHQIEAMLSAVARSDDPVVIQLLLSVARRHRTKSVQEKAKLLVDAVAERNHWTKDELADRTIPTAGLEANGEQVIEFGSRMLTASLDPAFKLILKNEQGKTLKALPAPRQDDDADLVKLAKKEFSSSKKELKQVVDLQGARFYEAMATKRCWHFPEWRRYLLEHPVMRLMIQRLIWQIEDERESYCVAITPELELIDLEDEERSPSEGAKIRVAHSSLVTEEEGVAWQKYLKAEKVKPLFEQFGRPEHILKEATLEGKLLDYHKGWLTDTFTLRSVLTKRGYQRGQAEDGGYFTHYYKDYSAVDLRVIVEFSGNVVPEENVEAVLFSVGFTDGTNYGWLSDDDYLQINKVTPSLLIEAMLDYEAVAAVAAYDPEWEKKTPW